MRRSLFIGVWGFLLTAVCWVPIAGAAQETGSDARQLQARQLVVARQDRIKSVQRKAFLKHKRWELTPCFAMSLNDAFYQRMGGGAAVSYHPVDGLGVEVQGIYLGTVQTDMVRYFQIANQALPKVSNLKYYVMGSLQWSPFYGKLSFVGDEIFSFDAYLLAGFGLSFTETGTKFSSNVGIGFRYYLTSWMVLKLEVRDLIYTETFSLDAQRTEYSDLQNHVLFSAGMSFFLPFGFNYEYQ
jgi:outer membrane beta-barrel protein